MASFFCSESESYIDPSNETQGVPCVDRRFFESTGDAKKKTKKEDSQIKIKVSEVFQELQTSKSEKPEKKRKSSSLQHSKSAKTTTTAKKALSHRDPYPYTERALLDPLSSTRKIELNQTLENLPFVKDKDAKEFNRQITKKVKFHFKDLTPISSSEDLETLALHFFEREISNETQNIATISNKDLVSSEPHRAKIVLTKIQKNAFLISELISRLIEIKGFILKYLKESNKTTVWYNHFYLHLNTIVSAYEKREDEMNPLKIFLFSFEKLDVKMKKIAIKCFKIEEKEFTHILNVFKKWGDFKTLEALREKVRTIDHKRTLDLLNFSTEDLNKQMHEWFESAESKDFLLNMKGEELFNSLTSVQFFLNKKKLGALNCKIDSLEENNFLPLLLKEIYTSLGQEEVSLQECKNQVYCMTHLDPLIVGLKADLNSHPIPWVIIQQKLQHFTSIPFFKFKKLFDPSVHLENLSNFLLGLAIPAFDLLKMGSKKSWQKADACLKCLFTDLFVNPSYQIKQMEEDLISHFQIMNKSFSVVQTKNYKISQQFFLEKSIHYATITFMWTISSCLEGLRGCLQISDVQFAKDIDENQKQAILKILNNPNIIDYVDNAITGKPKIISLSL